MSADDRAAIPAYVNAVSHDEPWDVMRTEPDRVAPAVAARPHCLGGAMRSRE